MANLRCTECGRFVNGPEDHAPDCSLYEKGDVYRATRVEHDGRTLDYVPRLDERNNQHLIRHTLGGKADWKRSRWWTGGRVLDQGSEGACVGFGVAGEYGASPVRGLATDELARSVYARAKEIDEWEGVDYDGTSVRAGMLVGRERGWWPGFSWAKSMDELLLGLQTWGPIVVGVEWKEAMYETSRYGLVVPDGPTIGWHCLLITGYSPKYRLRNWSKLGAQPMFRWRNSWGLGYGVNGSGYITPDALESILFSAGGEAAVIQRRALR